MSDQTLVFTKGVSVRGQLWSTFVFINEEARQHWIDTEYPLLKEEHGGDLQKHTFNLDGLKVGDKCYVSGEGSDVFTIKGVVCYSKNRYGFILDSGWTEEVYKCSKRSD